MHNWSYIWKNEKGSAVVEAAILFPIIFMIFFGLVILALYLPTRSALQYATQYTANAIATERSDTWLTYDEGQMKYVWIEDQRQLRNVYCALFDSLFSNTEDANKASAMVAELEDGTATFQAGELEMEFYVRNYVVYKEVVVTATRNIPSPINLSFVGFPTEIPITVSSTAVVQNGDEFVRNVDFASDMVGRLREKYEGVDKVFTSIETILDKFHNFLGI